MQYRIKKREVWIDNARALAIISVIWMHTANIGTKVSQVNKYQLACL